MPKSSSPDSTSAINRRGFLRAAAAFTGKMVLGKPAVSSKQEQIVAIELEEKRIGEAEEPPSKEKDRRTDFLIIDFWGDLMNDIDEIFARSCQGINEKATEILRKMGIQDFDNIEELKKSTPCNQNEIIALVLASLRLQYKNHGNNVSRAIFESEGYLENYKLGEGSSSSIVSLSGGIRTLGVMEYDEYSNPIVGFEVGIDYVNDLVNKSYEEGCQVINASFQLGRFRIKYKINGPVSKHPELAKIINNIKLISTSVSVFDNSGNIIPERTSPALYQDGDGNIITEEEYNELKRKYEETTIGRLKPEKRDFEGEDGYEGEDTCYNLSLMAELASKHPKKMFVAAAGNPRTGIPDIRVAKKKLMDEGKWPNNLILIGVLYNYENSTLGALGADYYLYASQLNQLGFKAASSFATPVVSEIVAKIIDERGYFDPDYIRGKLNLLSYEDNRGNGENVNLLDLGIVRQWIEIYGKKEKK